MLSPGPGTYDVRTDVADVSPTVLISSSPKPNSNPFSAVPGPGSYEVPSFIPVKRRKSPGRHANAHGRDANSLKPLKDRVSRTDNPGPGTYNPDRLKPNVGFFIGNKTYAFERKDLSGPGPGSYEPKALPAGQEMMLKTSLRSKLTDGVSLLGPGPAAYSTRSPIDSPQFGFGTGPKMSHSSSSTDFPGPGQYSVSGSPAKGGVTIAAKWKDGKLRDDSPGPGAYSPKMVEASKTTGFGTGMRSNHWKAEVSPGPGEYDPSHPLMKAGRKATLNTSPRRPLECPSIGPGPAAYSLPSTLDSSPKISLTARRADPNSLTSNKLAPGPGTYAPVFESVHSHRAFAGLGTSQRTSIELVSYGPGPAYDTRRAADPPFWGIHKEGLRLNRPLEEPGPTTYSIPPTVPDAPKYSPKAS